MTRALNPSTALLVIDVQIGLVTGAHQEKQVLESINKAIQQVRLAGGRTIFIQHCHATHTGLIKGNSGWQLHPALDVRDEDILVEKQASDAFYQTTLDAELNARGIDHLLVSGLQTEYCVDTTCRAALSKGYAVTLVSDAHTTGNSHLSAEEIIRHHNTVLANIAHPTGRIEVVASSDLGKQAAG